LYELPATTSLGPQAFSINLITPPVLIVKFPDTPIIVTAVPLLVPKPRLA
jgi:hypothetical protein